MKVLKEEESKSRGSVPVSISGDEAAKSKAKQLVDEFKKMYSLGCYNIFQFLLTY